MIKDKRKPGLVCWSGGCDSTAAILVEALDSPSKTIRTVSVVHTNVTNSGEEASRARKELIPRLKRSHGITILNTEVIVKTDNDQCDFTLWGPDSGQGGLTQPVMWLGVMLQYLEHDEDLVMGYIKGDDCIHYLHHLRDCFNAAQAVYSRTGKLRTPLEWDSKADVVKFLREHQVLDACWTCECPIRNEDSSDGAPCPTSSPCGTCKPCLTHKTALWQLDGYGEKHETDHSRGNHLPITQNTYHTSGVLFGRASPSGLAGGGGWQGFDAEVGSGKALDPTKWTPACPPGDGPAEQDDASLQPRGPDDGQDDNDHRPRVSNRSRKKSGGRKAARKSKPSKRK